MKIFILVVLSAVYGEKGTLVQFQEHSSLELCQKNLAQIKNEAGIKKAYCTEK